jgi:hypothetical protein
MGAKKKRNHQDPLRQLLEAADKNTLLELAEDLAIMRPEVRRECFEYLKKNVKMSSGQKQTSEGEEIFALWAELEPDLAELDEYGGGDYGLDEHVGDLLYQIQEKLSKNTVPPEYRTELLNEVLLYIHSSNAGLDDELYGVAYACCHDNDDLLKLAKAFEAMHDEWPIDHARRIYRKIGDHEKYLELRALKMKVGADYHDLATYYWELGKKEKAVNVAKDGLKKGIGRLDELRQFLSNRAQEAGDRQGYLKLQFSQTIDHLTLKKYQAFKRLCTRDEWVGYEKAVLKALDQAWGSEKLKIFMHRKEFDQAIASLLKARYPYNTYGGEYELQVAAKLEKRFPDKILTYYRSGLDNLNRSLTRKAYAEKAKVMKKVRHMYVDIMNTPDQWTKFARQVKLDNKKRPAFQEEIANIVPGWKDL